MPLNIEEVLIKVLTDTSKAVSDLKNTEKAVQKVGGSAKTSAKQVALLGTAIGGASGVIQLAIKAITSYVAKVKAADKAYADFARSSGQSSNEALQAIDRLEAAEKALELARGRRHSTNMARYRVWKATRKEAKALVIEYADAFDEAYAIVEKSGGDVDTIFRQLVQDQIDLKIAADKATEALALQAIASLSRGRGAYEGGPTTPSGVGADDPPDVVAGKVLKTTKELLALDRERAGTIQELARSEGEARKEALEVYREGVAERDRVAEEAHLAEMQRIEDEKQLRIQAAQQALYSASSFFSAIGTLRSNVLQNQIDAEEDGSDKQLALMEKQFNAEKAFAITQSIIATALGIAKAIPNIPLMIFAGVQGAIQTAAIGAQKFSAATGTSPSGYTVPRGYEDDSYPVQARSGEKVTVESPLGGNDGQPVQINMILNGRKFGQAITSLFGNRYATVPAGVIVS